MKISDDFEDIEILQWYDCKQCTKHSYFPGRLSALFFLQRFKTDEMAMASLRRLIGGTRYGMGLPISTDDEVLDRVAQRLMLGELHMTRTPLVYRTGAGTGEEPKPKAPRPPPRRATAGPPPLPEEPVFLPGADLAAIAQVQQEAANQGLPFCEE